MAMGVERVVLVTRWCLSAIWGVGGRRGGGVARSCGDGGWYWWLGDVSHVGGVGGSAAGVMCGIWWWCSCENGGGWWRW